MEGELRAMAQKMFPNESSDITIFGKQTTDKKLELMSRAHVLLVAGVREGWGLGPFPAAYNFKRFLRDARNSQVYESTIEQIGSDVERMKDMGVAHIIFAYAFSPIGKDPKKMIDVTTQLARFAR